MSGNNQIKKAPNNSKGKENNLQCKPENDKPKKAETKERHKIPLISGLKNLLYLDITPYLQLIRIISILFAFIISAYAILDATGFYFYKIARTMSGCKVENSEVAGENASNIDKILSFISNLLKDLFAMNDTGLFFIILLVSVVLFFMIRRSLLVNRRLSYLADRISRGMRIFVIPAFVLLSLAILIGARTCSSTINNKDYLETTSMVLIFLFSGALSIWATHRLDYIIMEYYLDKYLQQAKISDSIHDDIVETFTSFSKKLSDMGDIFGQNVDSGAKHGKESPIGALNHYLILYGAATFLYSPDIMNRLAEIYLKKIKMGEQDINDYRIDRLGHRWTIRGLETDYALIPKKKPDEDLDVDELTYKRVCVTVAPNGFLLKITVEEERRTRL
jgi:hypothetical protein